MKIVIAGRPLDAKLEYVPTQDRLMLRTPFALVAPESARQLDMRLLEATGTEVELLKASGYGDLASHQPVSP